ncbi:MAG TPA: NAD(P)H-hydrate dehydratase, partial [Thermoplasmata archaeon]|nr:NAD(P)H-hydrate dehydratase [Thermoplasmata archaeon]
MLSAVEMRVIDRNAEWMGVKVLDLMENAGRAVADAVLKEFAAKGKKVVIVCGPGNNGGDGLTAARYLKPQCEVSVLLARPPSELGTAAALANYEKAKEAVPVEVAGADAADVLRNADVIVDALFGIGVRGPVQEPYASLIRAMNEGKRPILSVDVPSGLGADVTVKPTATVALHAAKEGMTAANSGKILVAPIGVPPEVERTIGPGEFALYPLPAADSHKGENGRVLVIGGGPYTGAPALVAWAAYRIGADVVHIATPSTVSPILASFSTAFIVHPLGGSRFVRADAPTVFDLASGMDAVAIGPGLGTSDATLEAIRDVIKGLTVPVVIDSDAFPAIGGHLDILKGKRGVMTPHAREFAVASGEPAPPDLEEKADAASEFAKKTGFTILLKGPKDVVTDGERVKFTRGGNPGMTVGGTGDVLAGLTAGLLAKRASPFDAARIAAFANKYAG